MILNSSILNIPLFSSANCCNFDDRRISIFPRNSNPSVIFTKFFLTLSATSMIMCTSVILMFCDLLSSQTKSWYFFRFSKSLCSMNKNWFPLLDWIIHLQYKLMQNLSYSLLKDNFWLMYVLINTEIQSLT